MKLTKDHIKSTNAFKKLSSPVQGIILRRNNYRFIFHGVEVATSIGYDKWEKEFNYSGVNKEIVKEILETLNK